MGENQDIGKKELHEMAKWGRSVNQVVQSNGWQKVIRPSLLERRASLISDILSAKTYEQFVLLQANINAIDNLLSFMEASLAQGEYAIKELGKEAELS